MVNVPTPWFLTVGLAGPKRVPSLAFTCIVQCTDAFFHSVGSTSVRSAAQLVLLFLHHLSIVCLDQCTDALYLHGVSLTGACIPANTCPIRSGSHFDAIGGELDILNYIHVT